MPSYKETKFLKLFLSFFGHRFVSGFVSTLLGAMAAFGLIKYSFDKYLAEQGKRLDQTNETLQWYKSDTDDKYKQILAAIEKNTDTNARHASENAAQGERLARLEALNQIQTKILTEASEPEIKREFLPTIRIPNIGMAIGGPDLSISDGFAEMSKLIPYPRTTTEKNIAVEDLLRAHALSAKSLEYPQFDPEFHTFSVRENEVVMDNGAIQLQIISTIIEKRYLDEELP